MKPSNALLALVFMAATAQASDDIPTEFSTDIWTSFDHNYHIDFHDGQVVYSEVSPNGNPKPIEIAPTLEQ